MSLGTPNFPGQKAGMARAAGKCGTWVDDAISYAQLYYSAGSIVPWDEIRDVIVKSLGEPASPYCWGSVSKGLTNRGIMLDTGRMVFSRHKNCHARKVPEYRFL